MGKAKIPFARYFELTKPKVTLLNLFVGATCFVLASFPNIDLFNLGLFCLVGYLAAGGCGVLNSVYDQDIDRQMERTSRRAIPSGLIKPSKGLIFGTAILATSFILSYYAFNLLTFIMVGLGAAFYLVIYTVWLKRISPWNVVIGGCAGCFAALSGWTAAVNTLSLLPLAVAMLDFLWTPGHLWGLAIKKVREYKSAGIPMLPVTAGINKASRIIFSLNVLTVVFSLFPIVLLTGPVYLVVALLAGAVFIHQNRGLITSPNGENGFKVFLASMPYLACLMIALILDKIFFI
jgi:protoheme IX farnesyltransferase